MVDIMSKKRMLEIEETTTTDNETGEISNKLEVKRQYTIKSNEPKYIKLYDDGITLLENISNSGVVINLIMRMDYDNIISLNSISRTSIMNIFKIKERALRKILTQAIEHKIFVRIAMGVYAVNYNIAYKGKWNKDKNIKIKDMFLNYGDK
jgi:hypothetical protein